MNQLKVVSVEGQLVTDSRDVAEMIGMEHWKLLRTLEGTKDGKSKGVISVLTDNNIVVSDFFISNSYQDSTGRTLPSYLLTKKGCDMVANKMTGEKGILFTAAYVTQFEAMQEELSKPKILSPKEQLIAAMQLTLETEKDVVALKEDVHQLKEKVDNQITLDSGEQRRIQKLVSVKVYEASTSEENRKKLFAELHRELKDRFGVASYKDIKRHELHKALAYIESWLPRKAI